LISITREGTRQWQSMIALRTNVVASGLALLTRSDKKALEAALPALEHLVDELQGSGVPHGRR
jgi:sirohydrochlorin ferrochelatase